MKNRSLLFAGLALAFSFCLTSCVDNSVDLEREKDLRQGIERIERENALNDNFSVAPLAALDESCANCGGWSSVSGYEGFLNMQERYCTSSSGVSYKQYRQVGTSAPSCGTIAKCYCSPWTAKWGLAVKQCVRVSATGGETWSAAIWMSYSVPGGTWPSDATLCP